MTLSAQAPTCCQRSPRPDRLTHDDARLSRHPLRPARARPQPAVRDRRHSVAGARDRREYRHFHADRSDSAAQAAGRRARAAGDAVPARGAQRQQHGRADAFLSHLSGVPAAGRTALRSAVPAARPSLGQRWTTRPSGSMSKWSPATISRCWASTRQPVACSTRRRTIRSIRAIPVVVLSYDYWDSRFARDPAVVGKKILVNNYPMTIVGVSAAGFRRPRSRTIAADPRAGPDEAGDGAGVGVGAHGRSAHALGAGVRAVEARLDGEIGGSADADAVHQVRA